MTPQTPQYGMDDEAVQRSRTHDASVHAKCEAFAVRPCARSWWERLCVWTLSEKKYNKPGISEPLIKDVHRDSIQKEQLDITKGGSNALQSSAYRGSINVLKFLIANGADVNTLRIRDNSKKLSDAIYVDNVDIVRDVLATGVGVTLTTVITKGGSNALQNSAYMGSINVLKFLIANGADVNTLRATDNSSALSFACEKGHVNCVNELLKAGAPATDLDGFTSLLYAIHFKHRKCVELLLNHNVLQDVDVRDMMAQTTDMLKETNYSISTIENWKNRFLAVQNGVEGSVDAILEGMR